MSILRKLNIVFILIIIVVSSVSCTRQNKYTVTDFTLFDTDTKITGYDLSRNAFESKAGAIISLLGEYNRLFDIYYEYDGINNLKTVNDMAGVAPVEVDQSIIELLKFGIEMYNQTDGSTNIAMGSVLSIWHSYRSEGVALPPDGELKEASKHTDISVIEIDEENSTVYLNDREASLDVGAIAKGWATQKATEYAREQGWTNIAFSVGGNVSVVGPQPDGTRWKVGIQNPSGDDTGEATIEDVYLDSGAVVTSGSYMRFYEVDGIRYHHIINPKTLYPDNTYLSVSVICDDSGVADALSTALFNLSEENGREIAEKLNAEVIWVYPDTTISKTY